MREYPKMLYPTDEMKKKDKSLQAVIVADKAEEAKYADWWKTPHGDNPPPPQEPPKGAAPIGPPPPKEFPKWVKGGDGKDVVVNNKDEEKEALAKPAEPEEKPKKKA